MSYSNKTKTVKMSSENSEWGLDGDICVVGAGIAGISAAIAAGMSGKSVILIDSQQQIGGQACNSNIGAFCGFFSNGSNCYQLTHLVADDMFRGLREMNGIYFHNTGLTCVPNYNEIALMRWIEKEIQKLGIKLLLGAVLEKVEVVQKRIKGIKVLTRFGSVFINADGYIDASGDASLAWMAGFSCNIADGANVLGTQMFVLSGVDYSHSYPTSEEINQRCEEKAKQYGMERKRGVVFYVPERGDIFFGNMTHIETPLDPLKFSANTILGKDRADRAIEFLKNEFPYTFGKAFVHSYGQTGVRQTRSIASIKQLEAEDIRNSVRFDDSIGRTAWPIELHDQDEDYAWDVFSEDHVHYIPLSCMITASANNYVAAGRCIDADVEALSSVRVMGPCVATGVAAALALCIAGSGSIHNIDMKKLKSMLKDNLDRCD